MNPEWVLGSITPSEACAELKFSNWLKLKSTPCPFSNNTVILIIKMHPIESTTIAFLIFFILISE